MLNFMTKSVIHCMQQCYYSLMFHCWSYDLGLQLPSFADTDETHSQTQAFLSSFHIF